MSCVFVRLETTKGHSSNLYGDRSDQSSHTDNKNLMQFCPGDNPFTAASKWMIGGLQFEPLAPKIIDDTF